MASIAQTSDFLGGGGGFTDPFAGLGPDLTTADQQAARDAALRQQQDQNRALAARQSVIGQKYQNSKTQLDNQYVDAGTYDPQGTSYLYNHDGKTYVRSTGKLYDPVADAPVDNSLGHVLKEGWDTVKQHPWLPLLPAAPFLVAGAGAAAGGVTLGEALGGAGGAATSAGTAGSAALAAPYAEGGAYAAPLLGDTAVGAASGAAAAPGITTGGATIVPSMAAPAATGAASTAAGTAAAAAAQTSAFSKIAPWAIGPLEGLTSYGLGQLTSGRTDEEKALIAKQEQMAGQVQQQREQSAQASMDLLGQKMLAFNPMNQLMAKMYGPQAAFTGDQMAGMVKNPIQPQLDPSLLNYHGTDPAKQAQVEDYFRRKNEYDTAEQSRQDLVRGGITAPGPGPTPIRPITPLAAKRY